MNIIQSKRRGGYPRCEATRVLAVWRDGVFVPAPERLKRFEKVYRFVIPHNYEQLMRIIKFSTISLGKGLYLHIPKNMGLIKSLMSLIKLYIPMAVITTSLYNWEKRMCKKYQGIVLKFVMLPGTLRTWTENVLATIKVWLTDNKDSLGEICKKLNVFGIKISVKGLMKWRWKEIKGPPPVFVW